MKRLLFVFFIVTLLVTTASAAVTITINSTAANDGYTQRVTTGTSWTDIRNGAGTGFFSDTATILSDIQTHATSNNYSYIDRGVVIFDTSVIPDAAWISSAKISLYNQATNVSFGDYTVEITNFTIDGAISADDYDNYGSARLATGLNLSTLLAAQYYDWTLNAAGRTSISKTGSTGFTIRLQPDVDNASSWISDKRSYASFYSCDYSSCSVPPQLTVTYTDPPVTAFSASATTGTTPLAVTFTDASTESPTNWDWYWSSDETKDSDDQNPTTTFTTGSYNIRLYSANVGGGDWENKTAYIVVTPPPTDIYIVSITNVTNNGANVAVAGGLGGNVWVTFGQNPSGPTWKSKNVSAPAGTATVPLVGSPLLTSTTYYAHACQSGGCNSSSTSFTTAAPGSITQTNLGAGFDNLTESDFNMFNLVPDLMIPYTSTIPQTVFFGLILGFIVIGQWLRNKGTRAISILMILVAPLLFTANSGLGIAIPGAFQSFGTACLVLGFVGMLLSFVRR